MFLRQIASRSKYQEMFSAQFNLEPHEHVNNVHEVLFSDDHAYVFFPWTYGDIHTYIRNKRKLREPEAARLFHQIVSAVSHCHRSGIVLRDLKLRKFVFADPER